MTVDTAPQENDVRIELPWTNEVEEEIKWVRKQCEEFSVKHERARRKNKCCWITFGLPSMLVPLIVGGVGTYIDDEMEWVKSAALIITAVNSGVLQFFNFGEKKSLHNESSGKFDELADTIRHELHKPRNFRIPCDVFLERVTMKFANIKGCMLPV